MQTANLELCKELYELSGWYDTFAWYENDGSIEYVGKAGYGDYVAENTMEFDWNTDIPAYDLGYLLRKLQMVELDLRKYEGWYPVRLTFKPNKGWQCLLIDSPFVVVAETPEDAAAMLAVELLKSGVLPSERNGAPRASQEKETL